MDNSFEKDIEKFICELKSMNVGKDRFNPWIMEDNSDISNAAQIRCSNLKQYLIEHKDADYILIGESPSTGARYTGIAMTSERVMKDWGKSYQTTSKDGNKAESTATIVWNEINNYTNHKFVFWNAYAFNAVSKGGKKNYNCGSDNEVLENRHILENFCLLFPSAKIIAVGSKAGEACDKFGINICGKVRHPSRGGKNLFVQQLRELIP